MCEQNTEGSPFLRNTHLTPSGCWGGEGEPAMDFIVSAGGAAMEDDYPYTGVNGYCKTNQTAKVRGPHSFIPAKLQPPAFNL